MSSPLVLPLVQTFLDPTKLKDEPERFETQLRDKWRQLAISVNSKARSVTSFYLFAVPGGFPLTLFRTVVGGNTNLQIISASAQAAVPGAGGVTGLTLQLAGGSAALNLNFLPGAAVFTDLTQATLLNYAVPGGNTLTITATADDHGAGTTPGGIMFSFDCLYL
jgi:hypothetical protein